MIYINRLYERVKPKETYVLTDFDRTLTTADSTITWGVIEESPLVNPKFSAEAYDLYLHYRQIETDPTIDFHTKSHHMQEWHSQGIGLFNKYVINEKLINRVLKENNSLKLRNDSTYFLKRMRQLDIPVIIVSAGIGTVIEYTLKKQGCLYDNITILSNFLTFEDGIVTGFKPPEIHALNKGTVDYESIVNDRRKGILFGDQVEDTKLARDNDVTKVGFYDANSHSFDTFKKDFDLILTDETSFNNVGHVLIKGYKR